MELCKCGCGVVVNKQFVKGHNLKCKSELHLQKISTSKKGKNCGKDNPNFGNKWTNEQKQRMRDKMVGRYDGEKNPFYGRKHSEETKIKDAQWHMGKMKGDKNPSKRQEVRDKISSKLKGENSPWFGVHDARHPRFGKRGKLCPAYGKPPGHTKRINYISPLQGNICFRSSWEYQYAKYLDSKNELWYYEIETFELNGEMTYTPDFFLPRLNKFIEIKGRLFGNAIEKINKFKQEYPWDLEILHRTDLIKLGVNII